MRVALGLLVVSLCPAADFTSDIQPLLKKRCIACHGQAMRMNGLRLDTGELVLKGGYSGVAAKDADSMPASTHWSFQPGIRSTTSYWSGSKERVSLLRLKPAATITPTATRCGWPEAASRADR